VQRTLERVIEGNVKRFPHATFLITYPIYGRGYQDDLLNSAIKTGVRHILQGHFYVQRGAPYDHANRCYDFEPWGVGAIVIRPPPGFDRTLRDIVNTLQEVTALYGPSIHTAEEADALASRTFPPVDAQAASTFFVDKSLDTTSGWKPRPAVSWMTQQVDEHIKHLHSWKWSVTHQQMREGCGCSPR
jgi:hypothetical protein